MRAVNEDLADSNWQVPGAVRWSVGTLLQLPLNQSVDLDHSATIGPLCGGVRGPFQINVHAARSWATAADEQAPGCVKAA